VGDIIGTRPAERIITVSFITGLLIMYCDRRRRKRFYLWIYALVQWQLVAASLYAMGNDVGGTVAHSLSERIAGLLSAWGLVVITLFITAVPFQQQLATLIKDIGNVLSLYHRDIFSPIFNLEIGFFTDAERATPTHPEVVDHRTLLKKPATFTTLIKDELFMSNTSLVPIGVDHETGQHVFKSLADSPHILAAGKTDSGKTVFLQTLIAALASKNSPADLQFVLIDGVRLGFKPFAGLPHNLYPDILHQTDEVIGALGDAVDELNDRIAEGIKHPRMVIVIDEIDDYFGKPKDRKTITPLLRSLVKKGRQFNINIIAGSQRPSGDLIDAHILSMLTRVCLKVELPKYSKNIIEVEDGAFLKGKGDLLCFCEGRLTRAQGYYISSDDIEDLKGSPIEVEQNSLDIEWSFDELSSDRRVVASGLSVVSGRSSDGGGHMWSRVVEPHETDIDHTLTTGRDHAPTTRKMGFDTYEDDRPPTDQELRAKVLELKAKGLSQRKIAEAIGRSKTWVGDVLRAT